MLAVAVLSLAGCARQDAPEPPVASLGLTLSTEKAPLGSPIEVTYRFEVAPDAQPFAEDYRVFVGVVDPDEELMWTDDHSPAIPTTQWKAGQKVEYARTVFIPIFPYIGEASIRMGLYSPTTKKRLTLSGEDVGQRAYKVARFQLLPQTENVFTVYKEGWHGPENAQSNQSVEWQWTKKDATLGFKNPKKDSVFYLDVDNPSRSLPDGQLVQVKIGGQLVSEFTLPPAVQTLQKIPLSAAQLGADDLVELRITVDKTFVPANEPGAASKDQRELGIRVFHAFIEPKKQG